MSNTLNQESTTTPHAKSIGWWLGRLSGPGLFLLVGIIVIVLLGLAQRIGWISGGSVSSLTVSDASSQQIFTCPMHPQIRQPGPGRCPICGMALVPAANTGANLDEMAVTIEPAQRRLANIQTAKATEEAVTATVRTIGDIRIDESRQATIASYIDGRVERLFADYTGVAVEKGDHLAVVYSPQLYSAQVEYVESKKTLANTSGSILAAVKQAQERLVKNSRQRLVELGMTEEQLKELDQSNEPKSRLTIYAPMGGTVIEKLAEEGKYISAGEPIYRIATLSTVWLMLELYPEDASRIRFGQVVQAELSSLPGEQLTGRVAFIDPEVDKMNRTVGVRVEFKNDDGRLRPGDYAHALINIPVGPQGEVYDAELAGKWISPMHPQIIRDEPGDCPICGMKLVPTSRYGYVNQPVVQKKSLTVPRSALLMAGEHSVVYVETKPGRFELRNVTIGNILKDRVVILDGVKAGEAVATSGNFLIDSQMQLAGKPSLIDPTRFVAEKKQKFRNTPMEFPSINVNKVGGAVGAELENLYQAYFEIQRALAADKLPSEKPVKVLNTSVEHLAGDEALSQGVRNLIKEIGKYSPHLHHQSLADARKKFKSISYAVVTLSTLVRGEQASESFHQFFCPMVPQGEGDWLQTEKLLSNPYWGSQMLRCGELVRTMPLEGQIREETSDKASKGSDSKQTGSTTKNQGDH
ncbi:efflux RND transporter periplasmic adaptor subunit [Calycomorphotria hydatis]|uniref:Cation efflux system protein CusB n=1 Tax=Calycomorphotria hydatis TaxID=2528027 RepID=A0A517TE37_9PLAN|nr:efflux RND transporter periplasmic adaptor subunit [Calycomorphotria hydatis]QDT66643.1 Cation efflux system protein CusB precursor [Calycomorphotria hydatis]